MMKPTLVGQAIAVAVVLIVSNVAFGNEKQSTREPRDIVSAQFDPPPVARCEEPQTLSAAHSCDAEYYIHCSNADGHWCCPKYRTCGPKVGDCFEGGRKPY